MANRRPVLPEDLEDLLDFIQKGKLFALQDWLKAGKTLRAPDNAERGANVIRTAVTTGFQGCHLPFTGFDSMNLPSLL